MHRPSHAGNTSMGATSQRLLPLLSTHDTTHVGGRLRPLDDSGLVTDQETPYKELSEKDRYAELLLLDAAACEVELSAAQ